MRSTTADPAQGNFSAGNEMGFYDAEQEQASLLKTLADRFTPERQLPPVVHGRHRRQPLHARHRRCRRSGATATAIRPRRRRARSPIRTRSPARSTSTPPTTTSATAPTSPSRASAPIVSYLEALPYAAEPNCATEPLLHARTTPTPASCRTARGTVAGHAEHAAALAGTHDRRCAERKEDHLGVLRRRLQRRGGAGERGGRGRHGSHANPRPRWRQRRWPIRRTRSASPTARSAIRSSTRPRSWAIPHSAPRTSRTPPI